MVEFLFCLLIAILGCSAGFLIGRISARYEETVGYLRLDRSDPEDGPYFFLELDCGIPDLMTRSDVRLQMKLEDYISRD